MRGTAIVTRDASSRYEFGVIRNTTTGMASIVGERHRNSDSEHNTSLSFNVLENWTRAAILKEQNRWYCKTRGCCSSRFE